MAISISCLNVLGTLYLAYDLLGGQHGPLRLLSGAVAYSIIFGIGYGLGLGVFFGLAARIATDITMSVELNRAARGLDHYSLVREGFFSAIRGLAFGVGLYRVLGLEFASVFALLIALVQVFAYSRGMRPPLDHVSSCHHRLTAGQCWGTVVRTAGYTVTASLCSPLVHHVDRTWPFAIRMGLVTALVTGVRITLNPFIE